MELVNATGFEWFLGCRDLKMGEGNLARFWFDGSECKLKGTKIYKWLFRSEQEENRG